MPPSESSYLQPFGLTELKAPVVLLMVHANEAGDDSAWKGEVAVIDNTMNHVLKTGAVTAGSSLANIGLFGFKLNGLPLSIAIGWDKSSPGGCQVSCDASKP
jgi:hypothetical protein